MRRLAVILSSIFLLSGMIFASPPESYEYWIDNDYSSKATGSISGGSWTQDISLEGMTSGLHSFNFRMADASGEYGSVYRRYFVLKGSEMNPKTWKYWFDNNPATIVSGDVTNRTMGMNIDVDKLSPGVHTFNYQFCSESGDFGGIYSQVFVSLDNLIQTWSDYEYWLDNDYANKVAGKLTANSMQFEVPLTGLDKGGAHFFNMRGRNHDGNWGSIYRKLVVFYDNKTKTPITGYRHFLNEKDLGYNELPAQTDGAYTFAVDLPEDITPAVGSRPILFNGDKVSVEGSDSITYTLQLKSDSGWTTPMSWGFKLAPDFSTTAVAMPVNTSHTFDNPEYGEFAAIRFTMGAVPLYFLSDVPVALDIYKEGNKVKEITAQEVDAMTMLQLEPGDYFGILHDVVDNGSGQFTLRLMDTPNVVPTPVISYTNSVATITCSREDTAIYYTLDGSVPTPTAGTRYTEPIKIERNLTLRAMATIPGSGMNDSQVVDLVINDFKVATPTISVENMAVVITPDPTPGVVTYYTLDGSEPTESSEVYGAPFMLSGNVTVKARSFKDGYNPSDVAQFVYQHSTYVVLPPSINVDGNMVTLTAATSGLDLYYGIGNPDPAAMTLYTAPFPLTGNGTVYAQARKQGMYDSEVVSYSLNSFKVATPTINVENMAVVITPDPTPGVVTYYTLDGSEPTVGSEVYGAPFMLSGNVTVKARSFKDGYNPSDVAQFVYQHSTYVVLPPSINVDGNMVTLTAVTSGSDLYYGIGNPDPAAMTLYTAPFPLIGNGTVYAQARKQGMYDSEVVSHSVSTLKVATPTYEFNRESKLLTISCDTENAVIKYSFASETDIHVYTAPISIEGNATLTVYATAENYLDSDPVTITIDEFRCLDVTFSYDGRYLTLDTGEPGGEIIYWYDWEVKDGITTGYGDKPLDLGKMGSNENGPFNVYAKVTKQGYSDSETRSYRVEYVGGDFGDAWTSANGQLNRCFEWNGGNVPGDYLMVSGYLGTEDYSWICTQTGVRFLNISSVYDSTSTAYVNTLHDGALALPNLVWVAIPRDLETCGDRVFGDASRLCAIITPELTGFPENLIKNVDNPNLIVYNNTGQNFSDEVKARIIDVRGHTAERMVLHDGYPFYCPITFRGQNISYTREFNKQTGINGECAGWETIALPFDVETVTHAKGELAPFSVSPDDDLLRYWLYAPDAYEWQRADRIRAYEPYLIAMPNNPAYYEPYNVGGKVTFSATSATIDVTPDYVVRDFKGNRKMYASFLGEDASTGALTVNDEVFGYNGTTYAPGSHFVSGERDVHPFEAYVMAERSLTRMAIFTRSEVESLMNDMEVKIWNEGKTICILSGFSAKMHVYDTVGQLVRIADVRAGETMRIDDLNAGIYIVAGRKVMIH